MNEIERLWVHKDFKKKLKLSALENNMSVIQYTEQISKKDQEILEDVKPKCKKKKRGFDFGF